MTDNDDNKMDTTTTPTTTEADDGGPWVDVTEAQDGGIMKKVLVPAPDGAEGPPPAGYEVSAHYTGTLEADGSKFDSSVDRGQAFKFPIGEGKVIKGWDQGFATMKVGEKAILKISPDYGYGATGTLLLVLGLFLASPKAVVIGR